MESVIRHSLEWNGLCTEYRLEWFVYRDYVGSRLFRIIQVSDYAGPSNSYNGEFAVKALF